MFNALAMCAEGARGATAEEMGSVLRLPVELRRNDRDNAGIPWDLEPLHSRISKLNTWMYNSDQGGDFEIRIANALWGEKTFPLREEFVDALDRLYQTGGVFSVDFKKDAEGARRLINSWVEEKSNRRITEIIPPNLLNELTRLVLANAIYFRGTWLEPFDRARTMAGSFRMSDGTPREMPMMMAGFMESGSYAAFNSDGSFFETPLEVTWKSLTEQLLQGLEDSVGPPLYPDADGFAMLELPYKNERLSMVLIAPQRYDALGRIEQALSADTLSTWIDKQKQREVQVFLPRFTLETGYQMTPTIQSLGMTRAFENPINKGGADFRSMTVSTEPEDQLYISEILHRAFVDVYEEGTEAAAATAILMDAGALRPLTEPFTPTFKADRPFICIIRERPTGTILFMGRVMDPG